MDTVQQGFLFGIVVAAAASALVAAVFAAIAMIKVIAFERSTHQIEWKEFDPRNVGKGKNPVEPAIETGDEELDEALADSEELALEGLHGVHHRQGPLI